MKNKVIFYDCGHSGLDPVTKKYYTAPSKMIKFSEEDIFYEGVKNREYGRLAMKKMMDRGITVVPVFHDYLDTPLWKRTKLANDYHTLIQNGIYFSEHSNATPKHNARGFSIWTSPGKTFSDVIADKFIEMYSEKFKQTSIRVMKDLSDGDADYEAKFHVLTETKMPSVLFENLFFDNVHDVKLLRQKKYMESYTTLQADLAEWAVNQ